MEPIPRGRTIKVKEESIWVPFSYEKLPKICFKCGCLMHWEEGCSMKEGSDQGEEQFGVWLRASQGMRGRFYNQNLNEGREERTEKSREEGRGNNVREVGDWFEERVFKNRGSQESVGGQDKQSNALVMGFEVREITGQRKERKEEGSVTNPDLGGVESESQVSLVLEVEKGGGRGVEKEKARRMEEEVGKQGGSITEMKNNKRGAWKRRARAKGGQEGEEEGVVSGNKRCLEGEVEAKQAEKGKRARCEVGMMGKENSNVVAVASDQPRQSS
ncbi:hypothetical protein CIPAW_03G216000 [Carya illinoinensis]|uniref:Zinc knuckle CX2CX4HX4C domain-containing protein n=1 Tax=Carya illinoinensis TaxID=32201 RepID=A0A8T1R671_CARIL|nr:hypothetical protein CIPAW_03G216000 [Carya illinoinensis]